MITHNLKYAALLLVDMDNNLIFHQRDNKPNISNPGQIGMYGGGVENNETFEQAAIRELQEELGINIKLSDLEFYSDYLKTKEKHGVDQDCKVFVVKGLVREHLHPNPFEGKGYVIINPKQDISSLNLTKMAKDLFSSYSLH